MVTAVVAGGAMIYMRKKASANPLMSYDKLSNPMAFSNMPNMKREALEYKPMTLQDLGFKQTWGEFGKDSISKAMSYFNLGK